MVLIDAVKLREEIQKYKRNLREYGRGYKISHDQVLDDVMDIISEMPVKTGKEK